MKYTVLDCKKEAILVGDIYRMKEFIQELFEQKLGFYPDFQENDEDGLELYLHTSNYEDLEEDELQKLEELNITEFNSLEAICSVLEITILANEEDEPTASCTICGDKFPEGDVNLVDYDDDVCIHCEPTYKQTLEKAKIVDSEVTDL